MKKEKEFDLELEEVGIEMESADKMEDILPMENADMKEES